MIRFLKKIDYRYIVSGVILIWIISLSFIFKDSFVRVWESLKDFGLSIAYYFCELFYLPYNIKPTINDLSVSSLKIISDFNIFDFSNFQTFFDVGFNMIFNIDTLLRYLNKVADFLSSTTRFLLIFAPLVLLIILKYRTYFSENDNKLNSDSKFLKIFKQIELKFYNPIKNWLIDLFHFFFSKKFFVIITLLMFSIYFNVITIIVEFFAYYFYLVISFDFLSLFKQLYKFVIDLYPLFRFVPLPIWLILAVYLISNIRKNIAYGILNHYEMKNRGYINSIGQVSMICAPMGKGKTTVLTDMALSQEVMFRDKAFEMILENDLKFPFFPFIVFEKEIQRAMYYHEIFNLASARLWLKKKRIRFEKNNDKSKCFDYDFSKYGLYYDDNLKRIHLFEMLENYVQLYFIYVIESSLLVTNYSIREDNVLQDLGNFPMWHSDFFRSNTDYMDAFSRHSHILDFDMLRLGKKVIDNNIKSNAFEFGVVVITEGGKERKNTLELKETKKNVEQTNQKNDLFNMWLKMARHSATIDNYPFIKVLIDEQRPESMGADVRELCEKIIFIRDKKDTKTPLMFFYFETMIYDFLKSKFSNIYYRYRFVRSDNTLFIYLLKKLVSKYIHYYERLKNTFSYRKLIIESEKGTLDNNFEKNDYYIMDKKIYSNRFSTACFSEFFEYKSLASSLGLNDLEEYESEKATLNELNHQSSYFINELMEYTQRKE